MITYIADLETTTYDGQTETEAWASALIPITAEDDLKNVIIHHSLLETYNYLKSLNQNVTLYYHNLKFDGQFWLSFLLTKLGYKQGIEYLSPTDVTMKQQKQLSDKELIYSISDMGQWYTVTFKIGKYTIKLKDSLKLIPLFN